MIDKPSIILFYSISMKNIIKNKFMNNIHLFFKSLFLIISLECFLFSKFAFAYLDPGMITAFFQLLIAGLVGALMTIKFWWFSFKNFLSKIFRINVQKKY